MPNATTTRLTRLTQLIKQVEEHEHRDELIKLMEEQLIDDSD
tara:strand:- start:1946 stop:2071 length:126 start_codon:yes stop_codon:yes gene_type:complete